jgi:pimeloyl-ACP methyl ester carboxylesterase
MTFTEHNYLSHDGISLYYRSYGSGKDVVVCLPGLTRNSKDFHELAIHLAPHYRVICLDLRGRGRSGRDSDWSHYNPATYINDTWRLLDQLAVESFIVIGTSLGGLMAMIMASQRPQVVRAIVLNDVGPEADPAGYKRILASAGRQLAVDDWQQAVEHCEMTYGSTFPGMSAEFWDAFARKSFRQLQGGKPEFDMDPNIFQAILKGDLSRIAGIPVDPWDAFRAVTMPCLVLRGEISDILSAEIVERMLAVKPALKQATIPNRGHAPLLDEPESLAAIDSFLNQLP